MYKFKRCDLRCRILIDQACIDFLPFSFEMYTEVATVWTDLRIEVDAQTNAKLSITDFYNFCEPWMRVF